MEMYVESSVIQTICGA